MVESESARDRLDVVVVEGAEVELMYRSSMLVVSKENAFYICIRQCRMVCILFVHTKRCGLPLHKLATEREKKGNAPYLEGSPRRKNTGCDGRPGRTMTPAHDDEPVIGNGLQLLMLPLEVMTAEGWRSSRRTSAGASVGPMPVSVAGVDRGVPSGHRLVAQSCRARARVAGSMMVVEQDQGLGQHRVQVQA